MMEQAAVQGGRRDRIFYTGMALAAAATMFTGFSATFFQRSATLPELGTLFVVHGVVFTAWFLIFIGQTSLIAANRRDLHRKVGSATVILAAFMVVIGTMMAIDALRRGSAPIAGLDPRSFFAVPMFDMLCFPILVGAAFRFRRDSETHKRLMLLATVSILSAAIARIPLPFIKAGGPLAFFPLEDLFVLAGPAYDFLTRRRVHPAYIWGGLFVILSQPLRLMIGGTPMWFSFADLFLR